MNYRYVEGWQKREATSSVAYLLPLIVPALAILGAWASSLIG